MWNAEEAEVCNSKQKARNAECHPPFFYFMITLGRTVLLGLKTSSPHLSGKNGSPLYSPDLASSDYHLFIHQKKFLGDSRFDDDDDLKDAVQKWLTSQAAAFYEEGMQKLVTRYDKCLNNGGEYVEK